MWCRKGEKFEGDKRKEVYDEKKGFRRKKRPELAREDNPATYLPNKFHDTLNVLDCCFSSDVLEGYYYYYYPKSRFMVFNDKEGGDKKTQISDLLPQHSMTVTEDPWQYEGCPMLLREKINNFLRSSESWLTIAPPPSVVPAPAPIAPPPPIVPPPAPPQSSAPMPAPPPPPLPTYGAPAPLPPPPTYGAPAPPPPTYGAPAPLLPPPMYGASAPPPPTYGAPALLLHLPMYGAPAPPPPLGAPGPPGGAPPSPGRGGRRSNLKPLHWNKVTRALQDSLWEELQRHGGQSSLPEFDASEIERLFSAIGPKKTTSKAADKKKATSEKIQLIDLRRANDTEIMLEKVKMPLQEMAAAILAMDDTLLDSDQVENILKFCPTKEEMDQLKNYTGDLELLGKCEHYFLELMKVPRMEAKLNVFLFKIQFNAQLAEFKKSLNVVNSACNEVRTSVKLKEIMKRILYLENTLNQGTPRVGVKCDSLLKLSGMRDPETNLTLMHYLCKVLASKSPTLLDFHEDLVSLEAASKIQLKMLAEEMESIIKGLEKVKGELAASANEGPVSEVFHKTLKEFIGVAEEEVTSVTNLYVVVGRNANALALYFGEDPARCPFEQVTQTLLNFVRCFRKSHEENLKQEAELEKKKAAKEVEMEKAKGK